MRSHFSFWLRSDQSAAIETQNAAIGLAVVSDEAAAVGITGVPLPVTASASSLWFLYHAIQADESSFITGIKSGQFNKVDSKAMRKVEVGQDIVVVIENGGVGFGTIVGLSGRLLVKNN